MVGPKDKMINNIIPCSQEAHYLEETNKPILTIPHTLVSFLKKAKSGCLQEKVEKIKAKRVFLEILLSL